MKYDEEHIKKNPKMAAGIIEMADAAKDLMRKNGFGYTGLDLIETTKLVLFEIEELLAFIKLVEVMNPKLFKRIDRLRKTCKMQGVKL